MWIEYLRSLGGSGTTDILDFGDWRSEFEAWQNRSSLLDESGRRRFTIRGTDSASFLSRLLTFAVDALEDGQGCRPFILDARGRIKASFNCYRASANDFFVECDSGTAETLIATLDMYHFGEDFLIEDESRVALGVGGPEAVQVLNALGAETPTSIWGHGQAEIGGHAVHIFQVPRYGAPYYSLWFAESARQGIWALIQAQGATPSGEKSGDLIRIVSGCAAVPTEFSEKYTPLDLGAMDGITDGKGCYPGQEVIERTIAMGRPAVFLSGLQGPVPFQIGQSVEMGDKVVGTITSAAEMPNGSWVSLATIKTRYAKTDGWSVDGNAVTRSTLSHRPGTPE